MGNLYWKLDRLGRVRLSEHFYMRQFLYSEIGVAFGIPNMADDADLAIEVGTKLCTEVLEPLVTRWGPIVIRSGFRSARLNAFGAARGLQCAGNEKNFAYHIWDHRDASGHAGAAACIVAPGFNDKATSPDSWQDLAWWINDNIECYHRLTFFRRDFAFNIGWHEAPRREIRSQVSKPQWLLKAPLAGPEGGEGGKGNS